MLSVPVDLKAKIEVRRTPSRAADHCGPYIVALFSYRYDAHLVPGLLENISPIADAWISYDDTGSSELFSDEVARRNALLRVARDIGADWILAVDPDERLEDGAAREIRELVNSRRRVAWTFRLRELYAPRAYRIDGVWGTKAVARLFPIYGAELETATLHGQWFPAGMFGIEPSAINLYHLKMIAQVRRQHRRDLYAHLDPENQYQKHGYGYLANLDGLRLARIPEGRAYSPPHAEDGALWMPRLGQATNCSEVADAQDHAETAAVALALDRVGDSVESAKIMHQLTESPNCASPELCAIADFFVRKGEVEPALATFRRLGKDAERAFGLNRMSHLLMRHGKHAEAVTLAESARSMLPGAYRLTVQAERAGTAAAAGLPVADLWRRWAKPDARLMEGKDVGQGELAVVVISFGAPASLRDAVSSLLEQKEDTEIVVVNSGGGNVFARLDDMLPKLRVIEVAERLYAGGARNIGIDASRARYVAFLAADCMAAPNWVSSRLARHSAGAKTVSSAVSPATNRSSIALAANALTFAGREPATKAEKRAYYGLSYARELFLDCGYFNPGLRTAEDTEFNLRIAAVPAPDWAPEIITVHKDVLQFRGLLREMFARGARSARYQYRLVNYPSRPLKRMIAIARYIRERRADARQALAGRGYSSFRLSVALAWACLAYGAGLKSGARRVADGMAAMRASRAAMDGKPDHAIVNARHAIAFDPQNADYCRHLATLLFRRRADGDLRSAEKLLRKAMSLASADPRNHLSLAKVAEAQGRIDDLWAIGEEARLCCPADVTVLRYLKKIARTVGRNDEAELVRLDLWSVNPVEESNT